MLTMRLACGLWSARLSSGRVSGSAVRPTRDSDHGTVLQGLYERLQLRFLACERRAYLLEHWSRYVSIAVIRIVALRCLRWVIDSHAPWITVTDAPAQTVKQQLRHALFYAMHGGVAFRLFGQITGDTQRDGDWLRVFTQVLWLSANRSTGRLPWHRLSPPLDGLVASPPGPAGVLGSARGALGGLREAA